MESSCNKSNFDLEVVKTHFLFELVFGLFSLKTNSRANLEFLSLHTRRDFFVDGRNSSIIRFVKHCIETQAGLISFLILHAHPSAAFPKTTSIL